MTNNNDFDALYNAGSGSTGSAAASVTRKREAAPLIGRYRLQYLPFAAMLIIAVAVIFIWLVIWKDALMYIGLGTFVAAMLLMIPSFKTTGLLEPFSKEFRDARKLMRWGGGSAPYDYHMCAGFRELTADVDARLSRSWSRIFAIRIGLVIVAFVLLFIGIVVKTSPTSTRLILVALGVAFFALRELLYILLIGRTINTLAR